MKVLITGGAGFIGSRVAQQLLARGDEITILDDFNDRYDPRLKEARVVELLPDLQSSQLIRGDICNRDLIEDLFSQQQFDQVVHLAAWAAVQPSIERPHIYAAVNVDGTVNIFEAARKNEVKNIVFASSSSVYGGRTDAPFKETDDVSRPISPYAATKVAGELLCSTWNHLYQLPISAMRFFTVYGPWGRPEMALFKFTQAIDAGKPIEMRGHDTMRDFTYIDDIVQGIIGALDHPDGYRIYNLGHGDPIALPIFIKAIETALGKKANIIEVPLPTGDVPLTHADITAATKDLGYKPQTTVEEGVKKFVAWYRDWYVPNLGKS